MVLKSLVMLFNFEGTVKAALSATCGDNSEEDPPVPIPNTVVKLLSADDTWGVTLWEIRTSPLFSFFELIHAGPHRRMTNKCQPYFWKQRIVFFVFAKYVSKLIQLELRLFLTIVMFLDTENDIIVSAMQVAAFFARLSMTITNKLLLVIERE